MIETNTNIKAANITLRLMLIFVFMYAAIGGFVNSTGWVGFVPTWVTKFGFSQVTFLHLTDLGQIAISLGLLFDFKTKWLAWLSGLFLLSIVVFSGVGFLDLTFRDIGLAAAALALGFIS